MLRFCSALLLFVCVAGSAFAGERVALVIGNASYGRMGDLANPRNDAEGMVRLLEGSLDFQVISVLDADHEAMRKALTRFGRASEGADVALFFYAGHGLELDGASYLLPVAAEIASDVDLENEAFRLDRIAETLVRSGAKTKILLIDACRNNPLPGADTRGARSIGLAPLYAFNVNMLVAFAASPGKVAYDDAGSGHSPFTAALLDNLATPGLELHPMLLNVRNTVYETTQRRQFPWWDDMFRYEVYLAGSTAEGTGRSVVADSGGGSEGADMAACSAIDEKSKPILLQAYLDRFPGGFCAAIVRKYLAASPGRMTAALEPAPAEAVQTRSASNFYSVSSYWRHNGSTLALSANESSRVFYYEKPRPLMNNAGASAGTVLFKGEVSGMTYSGLAYLFSKRCSPVAYKMAGRIAPDYRKVVLKGRRPIRDANCRQIGTRAETLTFDFLSKDSPG